MAALIPGLTSSRPHAAGRRRSTRHGCGTPTTWSCAWSAQARVTAAPSTGVATARPSRDGGDTVDQLRSGSRTSATINDRQRFSGNRASCRLVDEASAGEQDGVGGDAGPTASSVLPSQPAGAPRPGAPQVPEVAGDDVDQRLRPCRVGVTVEPSPSALARSKKFASPRTVTGEELGPGRLHGALGCSLPIGVSPGATDTPPRRTRRHAVGLGSADASSAWGTRPSGRLRRRRGARHDVGRRVSSAPARAACASRRSAAELE